jgi:N-acetyl-gamma-glutamyl-phosphate reductase
MCVTVPLFKSQLVKGDASAIKEIYRNKYNGPIVQYMDDPNEGGFISATGVLGKDSMQIFVQGNEDRILLVARYDNLGKGASGAALQCMNIMMGTDITSGLDL